MTGETGPTGEAATIRVGTVTTGDPGTEASVTNSGTDQEAVLDFVIPRGENGGSGTPVELLSAYSTAPQPGTSGSALRFDRNSMIKGDAISHAENNTDFTISEAGIYSVAFNGVVAPASGVTFPFSLTLYLEVNGTGVSGSGTQHSFHTSTETVNMAFTVPVEVTAVPATLKVIADGDSIIYSTVSLTIYKIGESTP